MTILCCNKRLNIFSITIIYSIWTHLISVSRVENDGLFGAATRCRRSRRLSNGELGLLFVEFVAFFVVFLKDYLLSVAVWIVDDLNRLSAA